MFKTVYITGGCYTFVDNRWAAQVLLRVRTLEIPGLYLSINLFRHVLNNVVSSVDLACPIELRKVVMHIRNAEYNPRRFTGCVIRLREPRVTCLLFSTGKMVTTGGRSEESNNLGARKCARVIQKLGFPVQFNNFRIQNVVGIVDLKFPIRLEGLLMANEQMSQYEPEIFPGLIYRIINPKLVFLIFVNGKVIITGAKSVELIYEALNKLHPHSPRLCGYPWGNWKCGFCHLRGNRGSHKARGPDCIFFRRPACVFKTTRVLCLLRFPNGVIPGLVCFFYDELGEGSLRYCVRLIALSQLGVSP
ncbi:hypothetical protein TcWFU_003406 [Taenia crassiceps]|uniref:TATA-box-binding protein n=1 Tax=Taenia crassiceps TaxID=6207 RepID=A0ABR4Q2T4_9CEST